MRDGGRWMAKPVIVHHGTIADYRRNRVFEDQLLLAVVLEKNRVLVERADPSGQLHAADQINGDRGLVLADRIQKSILNVLCRLTVHGADLRCLAATVLRSSGTVQSLQSKSICARCKAV